MQHALNRAADGDACGRAVTVSFDDGRDDDARRQALYRGDIFVYSPSPAARALCDHARSMVDEAFAPHDPRRIHEILPVEACVSILADLKPRFIHHPRSKRLLIDLLDERGCDLRQVYFDVPRLRSAMPRDYLTSGIAYAFHPHRDTWYSAPHCQLNWWLPIYDISSDNCMAFHPSCWGRAVRNNSHDYDYDRWNAESRFNAAKHVRTDTRKQPAPQEPVDRSTDLKLLCPPGGTILFSAAQLHSTVPNISGLARYSIDFRTVHALDAARRLGAPNVDAASTGTNLGDFLRASDLAPMPKEIVARYRTRGPAVRRASAAQSLEPSFSATFSMG